uniref:Fak-like tyrosine kinase n=1 Tax=Schistosoma japonicum TaxID=6182 RepID=C1LD63_SCHJA|nr:Fak-like tyrosine kinase [Schistosoma japonicum]
MTGTFCHKSLININEKVLERILEDKFTLATTSFSNVYLGVWHGRNVVVKLFQEKHKVLARKELSFISRFEHENIIHLIAAGPLAPSDCSFLVFEYANCHSLQNVLYDLPEVHYTLVNALNWILQVSRASDYLHHTCSPAIIHADIKPSNILGFDKLRLVKLADFGSSRTAFSNEPPIYGTLCYMAPELWTVRSGENLPYSEKSDVYSLTVTFWEFLARKPPHQVLKRRNVSDKFWSSITKRPPILDGCPELLNTIIQSGWAANPKARPTMFQLSTCLTSIIGQIFPIESIIRGVDIPAHCLNFLKKI